MCVCARPMHICANGYVHTHTHARKLANWFYMFEIEFIMQSTASGIEINANRFFSTIFFLISYVFFVCKCFCSLVRAHAQFNGHLLNISFFLAFKTLSFSFNLSRWLSWHIDRFDVISMFGRLHCGCTFFLVCVCSLTFALANI